MAQTPRPLDRPRPDTGPARPAAPLRPDTADLRAYSGLSVNAARLIVVGVDGSPTADAAVRWAVHIGRAAQALIHVIAVCADGAGPEAEANALVDVVIGRSLAANPGGMITGSVRRGEPAAELVEASIHATMLVLGSHGRSRTAHLPMGSVAAECTRAARCPIVIVPAPGRPATPANRAPGGLADRMSTSAARA